MRRNRNNNTASDFTGKEVRSDPDHIGKRDLARHLLQQDRSAPPKP